MKGQLFWKAKAIQFSAVISRNGPIVRPLFDNELETMIDDEYRPFSNGLYRFSKNRNDESLSFFVTRLELKEYLKNKYYFVSIPFKETLLIDKQNCLYFKQSDKSE